MYKCVEYRWLVLTIEQVPQVLENNINAVHWETKLKWWYFTMFNWKYLKDKLFRRANLIYKKFVKYLSPMQFQSYPHPRCIFAKVPILTMQWCRGYVQWNTCNQNYVGSMDIWFWIWGIHNIMTSWKHQQEIRILWDDLEISTLFLRFRKCNFIQSKNATCFFWGWVEIPDDLVNPW